MSENSTNDKFDFNGLIRYDNMEYPDKDIQCILALLIINNKN